MNSRKIHKTLGFILLLPFIGWAITGVFFFVKPGYSGAYDQLRVKSYPAIQSLQLPQDNQWDEVKVFKSALGKHLLVKENGKSLHLDSETFEPANVPSKVEVTRLINDAIEHNPERYGVISSVVDLVAYTSTNVEITLNWQNMTLRQQGEDTAFINRMYKIHYLQWTGVDSIDKVLGIVGLGLVVLLAILGIKLSFKRSNRSS